MARKSVLEMKIRWYLNSVESAIDMDSLEIILLSEFDDKGRLTLPSNVSNKEKYDRYWKKLQERLKIKE